MIKNHRMLARFEEEQIKKSGLSYRQSLKLAEALWAEGVALGILPPKNKLEGIETDIRMARLLNQCLKRLS